jgi:hypothetical protein
MEIIKPITPPPPEEPKSISPPVEKESQAPAQTAEVTTLPKQFQVMRQPPPLSSRRSSKGRDRDSMTAS